MHKPGPEVFFHSLLNPEKRFSSRLSKLALMHSQVEERLRDSFGIRVGLLDDLIREIPVSEDNESYTTLQDLASDSVRMRSKSGEKISSSRFMGTEMENMDSYSLYLSILYGPSIRYNQDRAGCIELDRILNGLLWMNDYYLTIPEGLVIGMASDGGRAKETSLAELAVKSLGIRPAFRITAGTAEGGDIIPAGDFILIGRGRSTNIEGIMELISLADLHEEIVIVHEPIHPLVGNRDPLVSGHLDTYLNFPRDGIAIGDPVLLRSAQVEVFHKESSGFYRSENAGNLLDYIRSRSIDLIELNTLEQLCNASGFLCVYEGECIGENINEKAPVVIKKIRERSAVFRERYDALLNRAEHDLRQMRYDGSRMMDREFLSDYGVEFMYVSGEATGVDTGTVRRCVGIVSRR